MIYSQSYRDTKISYQYIIQIRYMLYDHHTKNNLQNPVFKTFNLNNSE